MRMFIGVYHISNLVTYLGMASAVSGFGFAVRGQMDLGMLCLVFCGICDLFDGVFARRFKRTQAQKEFGVQIDSLADVISFAALPAVLLLAGWPNSFIFLLLIILYVMAALTRLGYFNLSMQNQDTSVAISHYTGLPVTYASFFIPLCWLLSYTPAAGFLPVILGGLTGLLALLFVLNIKVPKPKGLAYGFFSVVALATAAVILLKRL